ncbi:MAG: FAD-binding oxidoreductase [Deltaproteobacteria bacterium]|nr:FAD-binding oxidoreductase [Deltaproteobacteria bacterium]
MSNANQLASALKEMVGEANVIQDPDRIKAYAVDGMTPRAVVSPGNVAEVSKLLAYANSEKLAVVPRGNGTKMAQGGAPRKLDMVLSLLRINRITEHDVPNLSLSVEAGITLAGVQEKLAGTGKGSFLPLDPPYTDKATIGGIIATNGSGPRRYLYNTARDLLLGLKAVSPNGDIVAFGGKTVKNVSGYDMTKLMIGSWGALGVITEITTKLLPLPEASATLLVSFEDLEKAGSMTKKVLHSALLPSAMELMDGKAAGQLGVKGKYPVAFSLEGVGEAVDRQVAEIGEMGKKEGAIDLQVLKGREDHAFWIRVRDFALALKAPFILKSNFVISKQAEILGNYENWARAAGIGCALIGHAGNGILTTYILENGAVKKDALIDLIGKFTAEAVKHDGNLVVEACPTELKAKIDVWGQLRTDEVVMRRLKEKMDPVGILNPGRFVGGL